MEREREIGTNDVMYYNSRATITKIQQPTLTKGYKGTLYSDYLRATALYTIYRNNPNLGCPKGLCEYGHYTLVFDKNGINVACKTFILTT